MYIREIWNIIFLAEQKSSRGYLVRAKQYKIVCGRGWALGCAVSASVPGSRDGKVLNLVRRLELLFSACEKQHLQDAESSINWKSEFPWTEKAEMMKRFLLSLL